MFTAGSVTAGGGIGRIHSEAMLLNMPLVLVAVLVILITLVAVRGAWESIPPECDIGDREKRAGARGGERSPPTV